MFSQYIVTSWYPIPGSHDVLTEQEVTRYINHTVIHDVVYTNHTNSLAIFLNRKLRGITTQEVAIYNNTGSYVVCKPHSHEVLPHRKLLCITIQEVES